MWNKLAVGFKNCDKNLIWRENWRAYGVYFKLTQIKRVRKFES